MKKWHVGLKLLAIVLSIFLALPGSILAAAAAKPTVKIKHDPPKYYIPGFRIILDADIEDETDILVARCYFKTKHEKSPLFVDMVPKGNPGYQAELPAPWINSEAIDYRFVVVDKDKKVIATQLFTMKEKETEQAVAWKEVSEVQEVRLDQAQEVLEKYEVIKKDLEREYADKLPKWQRAASEGRLAVLTELETAASGGVRGFYDDLFLTEVSGPSKYGLLAEGLYTDAQIAAAGGETAIAASTGAVSAGTISATGVIGMGTIALGALALGGLAAAGGGGGGGGGGGSSGSGGGGGVTPPDGEVTSRDVTICVIDHNEIQDDFYDLYVNGIFIGPVNNPPGGTTCYNATLKSGSNTILLKLTELKGLGTLLTISINSGEFSREFGGSKDHSWIIAAP